ncbi:MAG TPA: hypothetical protein VMU16_03475 [Candidatus Binataceae bacterium]|nr:hypothetical protein [Candidatus Binataceae bacterium]
MRKSSALVVALAIVFAASPASAGVVITYIQRGTLGTTILAESHETMMLQGHKGKIVTETHPAPSFPVSIVDLDKYKTYMLNPSEKSYLESSLYPGAGAVGELTYIAALTPASEMKRTGTTRTIAGYKCVDYELVKQNSTGKVTSQECLSTEAPGSKEWELFYRYTNNGLHSSPKNEGKGTISGKSSESVPLALNVTIEMSPEMVLQANKMLSSARGLPLGVAAEMKQAMANRKTSEVHVLVMKIEAKLLANDVFEIPAGYIRKEMLDVERPPAVGGSNSAASPSSAPMADPLPTASH